MNLFIDKNWEVSLPGSTILLTTEIDHIVI